MGVCAFPRFYMLTTFEDMYETHEQCAQLLAVEGVLLLSDLYFNLPGWNVIQQHTYKLEKESRWEVQKREVKESKKARRVRPLEAIW